MNFTYLAKHLFVPGHSNNHKAKLIHSSTMFLLIFSIFIYQVILHLIPSTGVRVLGYAANISPTEVINLTNQERINGGLAALNINERLNQAARAKGEHMLANDYWAHVAPDGTEPWYFFSQAGYEYRYAGENLARDFSNPSSAVAAWMASPSHRENLMSSRYSEMGIAVVEGELNGVDTTIIVQLFGTNLSGTPAVPVASVSTSATEEIVPAVLVTPLPTLAPSNELNKRVVVEPQGEIAPYTTSVENRKFLISPFSITRGLSMTILVALLSVLVIDGLIVSRRNIPRISGRTLAHVTFLFTILAIVVIASSGQIL